MSDFRNSNWYLCTGNRAVQSSSFRIRKWDSKHLLLRVRNLLEAQEDLNLPEREREGDKFSSVESGALLLSLGIFILEDDGVNE